MKKIKKYPKFEDYDFSGCREITGDELYRINGGGLSASFGLNYGEYKDLESAQGKYYESGLSAGPNGISLGVDFVCDSEYQYIGNTMSLSFGVGTPEGHTRLGGTRLYSVMRKEND